MKVLAGRLRFVFEGLEEISKKELPFKLSYTLAKLHRKIVAELEPFEEARLRLLQKHAKRGADGRFISNPEKDGYLLENVEEFTKEYLPIASEEVEIDFPPIKASMFDGLSVAPEVLFKLSDFIEE